MRHLAHLPACALLVALCGCAPSVIPEYLAARDTALARPGPVPEAWEPDAVVVLAPALVDRSIEALITDQGRLEGVVDLGLVRAVPSLKLSSVDIRGARCERCIRVDAGLAGSVRVDSALGSMSAPVKADLEFDAVFDVVPLAGGSWQLAVAPKRIHKVDVRFAGTDLGPVTEPIAAWVEDAFADAPPMPLVDLGSAALPLRAIRVVPQGEGLRLDLLTDTPKPVAIAEPDAAPQDGWRLDLSADALLDLARIASFQAEPLAHGIVPEPTSLYLDKDRFSLGLRLWRTKGRGWWRDYRIDGTLRVEDGQIALKPDEVADLARSRGAAWADPLAALGQGVILKTLEKALETSLPAVQRDRGEALRIVVEIEALRGQGAVVVGEGQMRVLRSGR